MARTTEQLKKDHEFDQIVAEIVAKRLRQIVDLDLDRVIQDVMAEINPGIHRLLPDDPGAGAGAPPNDPAP